MPKTYSEIVGDAGSGIVAQVVEQQRRVASRMAKVARTVAVMSGKGGVGKSMVTANLAAALAGRGHAVGALDADLSGPILARLLGAHGQFPQVGETGVTPAIGAAGVRVMSMDLFLTEDETPVVWDDLSGSARESSVWRGTMEATAIREFVSDTEWGELDFLLIDLPPGAHAFPELLRLLPDLDGAIVVTTASEVSRLAVSRSITLAKEAGASLLGVVENMAGYHCAHCGVVGELFPSGEGENSVAEALGVSLLGRVPFDPLLARSMEGGAPFVLEPGSSPAGEALIGIADRIERLLE